VDKIITFKVEDDIVNYFLNLNITSEEDVSKETATIKGYQTSNIIHLIDPQLISFLKTKYFSPAINNMKGDYIIKDLEIDHIHYIKYDTQGKQKEHNHEFWEDYSFILYLNNCNDGHTLFYDIPKPHVTTPKKGEIVLFKSYLYHEGLESNSSKEIIVGSIREIGKKWIPRIRKNI